MERLFLKAKLLLFSIFKFKMSKNEAHLNYDQILLTNSTIFKKKITIRIQR